MNNTLEQLREELRKSLEQENTDYQKVLNLANQIALYDQENVRFSVDASHISKLGLELVAKQETAIAELVKNAYDADSTNVDLIFTNTDIPGGNLEIIDNGLGMTREQLINGFMRISTGDKVKNPVSDMYLRKRAGRKGIGRFSAQRLGKLLTIKTQIKDADIALEVTIDWDKFESNKDLIIITNKIKEIDKLSNPGTTLKIQGLRDSWSEVLIKRSYRHISELLQPFPISPNKKDENIDPGFKVAFYKENSGDLIPIADEDTNIFQHALAVMSGYVSDDNQAYWECSSTKYKLDIKDQKLISDKDNSPLMYDQLNSVHFKAYYYITDELPSGATKSQIRELLTNRGGIRVYRNGFRVLPYGEAYDDWLGFQRSSALRKILPPHHNTNFFGFVEIHDPNGERFNETSSREGLIENTAFSQLQDFVYRGLIAAVIALARVRSKKVYASEKPKSASTPAAAAEEIVQLIKQITDVKNIVGKQPFDSSSGENDQSGYSDSEKLADEIAEKVLELGNKSQNLLEENGMLRVLAALGITIGEFTHEIRHSLGGAMADVGAFADLLNPSKESQEALNAMQNNLQTLQAYARYFDESVLDNAHRKLEPQELRDVLNNFENVISPTLVRQHIEIIKEVNGYDLFTRPMHKSEWASILLNLFTNSIKAIKRAKSKGKILISAGVEGNNLFIEFSDNGSGISAENQEKIFDAFFTTSAPASALASDTEQLTGTGLGLKIVKDIVDGAEGDIYLTTPPPGFNTCFRIEIPKAEKEEIPNDAY